MKKRLIILGIVLLMGFALFSREIKQGAMREMDFTVTVKLQERIDKSPRLRIARLVGELMEGSTFLASPAISVVAVLIITGITFIKKKKNKLSAFIIPILFALLVLAEVYGKSVVHHPAPPFFMIKNPTTIFPKYYVNDEFSYPSGHAARAVFIGLVSYSLLPTRYLQKRGKWWVIGGLAGYIGLVAISRIYLGHHWLSDVLGGGLLGTSAALLGLGLL